MRQSLILGAGVTGLAAGRVTGWPILEAASHPGGICSSYYAGSEGRRNTGLQRGPHDYRFEFGGGHWLFGVNDEQRQFFEGLCKLKQYRRQSAVYFPDRNRFVPYPLQHHLDTLEPELGKQAQAELAAIAAKKDALASRTMSLKCWLHSTFGPLLCDLFFFPFNERYTAGLYDQVAPQDLYKTPAATGGTKRPASGYNAAFLYPEGGNAALINALAEPCRIQFEKTVCAIDTAAKTVHCADGSAFDYQRLISTLPLNSALSLSGITASHRPSPYTSVLVLNIGALRGPNYPPYHWLYFPHTDAGFHRMGFYNNVEPSFLPPSGGDERTAIYVEKSYPGGTRPDEAEVARFKAEVIDELKRWGFIEAAEVIIADWIEVAYTWSWHGEVTAAGHSAWAEEGIELLAEQGVIQTGRFARWRFQGIAESIGEGIRAGEKEKEK